MSGGSTTATAIVGGLIGVGVATGLPTALNASTLTPEAVRGASAGARLQVAELYADVLAPIFIGLAIVYVIGVVAALLLPDRRLSDEIEHPVRDAAEAAVA